MERPKSIGSMYYNRLGQFFILFVTMFLLLSFYALSVWFNGGFEVSTNFVVVFLFFVGLNMFYYRFSDVIVNIDTLEAKKLFSVKRKSIIDAVKVDQMAFPFIGFVEFKDGSRFYSMSNVVDILEITLKNKPNKMILDFEMLKKFHDFENEAKS